MDTGRYLSGPLGGRPRLARGFLSLAAIADRAAFTSSSVTRRARSKGNSLRFFIASPPLPTRAPCADEPVDVSVRPDPSRTFSMDVPHQGTDGALQVERSPAMLTP